MDIHSTLNNKIRKTRIRIVVYVLMLMMLRTKTKTCTMVKYKRSRSLTFTVSRQIHVLYKTTMGSLALTLTIKDVSRTLSCKQNTLLKCSMFQTQQTKDLRWLYLENDESLGLRMPSMRKSLINSMRKSLINLMRYHRQMKLRTCATNTMKMLRIPKN
jgi:hypothetical protein